MKQEPHKFVEDTIKNALKENASDIFFMPEEEVYNVRMRVNGLQKSVAEIPSDYGEMCVAHIKALSGLLTYRTKISQDGVIRSFEDAELRISTLPTICGERISIRVLMEDESAKYLEELNFQTEICDKIKKMVLKSNGLTILTGPTGCGKTTTIYAMIRELLRNSQDPASIITIEDPVECVINGISQTSVTKGDDEWGYEKALRAALRQNVKTLIIGEMRDKQVVKVALDAALTGHRVITTFHAGDIPSVFARMLHQGFEPFLIAAAVTGVVTQRLVKSKNNNARIPVAGLLEADDAWKDFISENPPLCEIRRKIDEIQYASLYAQAEDLAGKGLITGNWKLEV